LIQDGLLLAVDTCGAIGSVGLGRLEDGRITLLGEMTLAGGEFAARLVDAIADLLDAAGVRVSDLAGIVAVAGPGSFTGIRIGLAAVKALAVAGDLPVVTVSRLELLAAVAGTPCAVLDAHRGQVFCGFFDAEAREVLLTAGEVNAMGGLQGRVAVCEEAVVQFLEMLLGEPEFVRVAAPGAAAALEFSVGRWQAGVFADVAALDGHYLRGADAKIGARS
jgi:tRNA threonylcarbamoyladenosine biosynthesis protein TsaB